VSVQPWSVRELLAYLDRVEPGLARLNYYELLDVGAGAGPAMIQEAFHRLASRIHPDRYRTLIDPADHARLSTVYARLSLAYSVLRDGEQRRRYLEEMAKGRDHAPSRGGDEAAALKLLSPKAQRLYRRARASMSRGDASTAVLELRMALAHERGSQLLLDALADAEVLLKR
jgi:curved DNA-binding protein CbpA